MSVIRYNKLVRDKIPEIIESDNKSCDVRILDDTEYLEMVDAKLDEELAEYHKDQNLEELADVLEVVYAAAKARGYSIEELESLRKQKADKRGGFDKKIFLESVTEK
jgi:predicted house-cleaning noncanonical NTP pyrophosphatase (MazG superfamily)